MPDAGVSPDTGIVDHDLFCLSCRYNLRGLDGDPVRCPECGECSPRSVATVPSRLVSQQIKKFERDVSDSGVALVFVLVTLAGTIAIAVHGDAGEGLCCGGLCVLFAGYWLAKVLTYRRRCRPHGRWIWLLVRYYVLSGAALLCVIGSIWGAVWAVGWLTDALYPEGPTPDWVFPLLTVTTLLLCSLPAWLVVRWLEARARTPLSPELYQSAREEAFRVAWRKMTKK